MIDTPSQRESDVAEKFDDIDTVASMSLPAKHIMTRRIYDGHVKAHVQIVV